MTGLQHRRTERIRSHGLRWLCVEEFAEFLPLVDVDRVRRPDELGPDELIKDNTVRTVARLPDPLDPGGPGLYVKRFKFRSRGERLKHLVLPTKPVAEWRACRALQAAGIPTCDVLAIAVRRSGGLPREGLLISREVAGSHELRTFMREQMAGREKAQPGSGREIVEELGVLTADVLNAGFRHTDYHMGNVLICPEEPAGRRLYVLDHHSFRFGMTRGRAAVMLGMLSISFDALELSGRKREVFWSAFLDRWKVTAKADQAARARWLLRVGRCRKQIGRRHIRSRTKRCLIESTVFARERTRDFVLHRRRDFPLEAALEAVGRHEAAMAGNTEDVTVHRQVRRTQLSICPCPAVPPLDAGRPAPADRVGPGLVCVKAYRRASLLERLKDLLRVRSRARTAWVAAHGFAVRGIPAARPLALLESRRKMAGAPDYLITEALETDGALDDVTKRGMSVEDKKRLGIAVAELLRLLEAQRVYHPDTKPNNVLVRRTADGFRLWLVDLDRASFDARPTRDRTVKVLARLNAGLSREVTALDRMRCLRAYWGDRDPRDRRRMARQVHELSLTRRPKWLD